MMQRLLLFLFPGACIVVFMCSTGLWASDEFVGPMTTWRNVKTDFNARGNDTTDDRTAIQSALNALKPDGNNRRVLYFPAGTYRITGKLQLLRATGQGLQGISLYGEDPATTIIKYDGTGTGADSCIFLFDPWYSSVNRLTFDGQNKTKIAIEMGPSFGPSNEFTDCVFKNVQTGIQSNKSQGHSETGVFRCQFINCSNYGFYSNNFNTLNWWFWYCTFQNCGTGLYNNAGCFNVYYSLFKGSTNQDIFLHNTTEWGIRFNYSIGSKAFLVTSSILYGDCYSLQGNTILDYTGPYAIDIKRPGTLAFMDNSIRNPSGNTGACIRTICDVFSLGNKFTVATPHTNTGRIYTLDDTVSTTVNAPEPVMPGPLPKVAHSVFEVSNTATGADIQAAIVSALGSTDPNPVVYIPEGSHTLSSTLTIPANRAIQIIGAGIQNSTTLRYSGGSNLPAIRLVSPSRAVIKNLYLSSDQNRNTDLIQIENTNQVGARVFIQPLQSLDMTKYGMFIDGLSTTLVEAHGMNCGTSTLSDLKVVGDGQWSSTGRSVNYGCNTALISATNKARVLMTDLYSEISKADPVFILDSTGADFCMDNCDYKHTRASTSYSILLSNFNGKCTFLACTFQDLSMVVGGAGTLTNFLAAGSFMGPNNAVRPAFTVTSTNATYANVFPKTWQSSDPEAIVQPNQGSYTDAWMREMFAHPRSSRPSPWPLPAVPSGATDVRIFRVFAQNAQSALHIIGGATGVGPMQRQLPANLYKNNAKTAIFTSQGKLVKLVHRSSLHSIKNQLDGLQQGVYVINNTVNGVVQKITLVNK